MLFLLISSTADLGEIYLLYKWTSKIASTTNMIVPAQKSNSDKKFGKKTIKLEKIKTVKITTFTAFSLFILSSSLKKVIAGWIIPIDDVIPASGKTGLGVDNILEAIIEKIPAPKGQDNAPLEAMIFDSVFNSFRGIIAYFRVFNGVIKKGQQVKFFNTGKTYDADEIGVLKMDLDPKKELASGDVGYIISGIKKANEVKVGDTITSMTNPCESAIRGFEDVKPMVFAGIYPVDTEDYEELRASMEKLQLNDASLVFEPESSAALGFGFRCGFLGMLHMEIIQERLEREFNMTVITTVPNVSYRIYMKKDLEEIIVNNPSELPEPSKIDWIEEPYIKAQVITKSEFVGAVMNLCIEKRGELTNQVYLTQDRVELSFLMPLSEIVFDFYDRLKSVSIGYASFDYSPTDYKKSDLIKLDI